VKTKNTYLKYLLLFLLVALLFTSQISCAVHSTSGMTLNEAIEKMYSSLVNGDSTYFYDYYSQKSEDSKNPFEVYNIEVLSYKLLNLDYAADGKARATMKLAYRYDNKRVEEFLAMDVWEKIDGAWRLVDFNKPVDESQHDPNYRVKPYIFKPEDFR